MREKLTRAAENLNAEFGIEAARLDIVQIERMRAAPHTLAGVEEAEASAGKIASIGDVLSARLGAKRVLRPRLHDVHAPEKAGAWVSALKAAAEANIHPPEDGVMRRPLTLFARPQAVEAIATVPDGPPIRFRWRRVLHEIARAEGPERIAPEWWRDGPGEHTRDYYRVEDAQGRRFWLYRAGLYGRETTAPRWYLHGLFA